MFYAVSSSTYRVIPLREFLLQRGNVLLLGTCIPPIPTPIVQVFMNTARKQDYKIFIPSLDVTQKSVDTTYPPIINSHYWENMYTEVCRREAFVAVQIEIVKRSLMNPLIVIIPTPMLHTIPRRLQQIPTITLTLPTDTKYKGDYILSSSSI